MIEKARDTMQQWATARGLAFEEAGLLPPVTQTLRRGLGVGAHRAGFLTKETKHTREIRGGLTRYEERSSHHLCTGALPGGVDGVVAQHLTMEKRRSNDGESWVAVPRTVVLAFIPEGSRCVRQLTATPGKLQAPSAGMTLNLNRGHGVAGIADRTIEHGGYIWRAVPAEDDARILRIARGAEAALAHAPEGTRVELNDGALCVSTGGIVTDAAVLDLLCHIAGGVAGALVALAAAETPLDPATPVGPPPPSARADWLDQGVAHVRWSEPPASVAAAQAAYQDEAQAQTHARGVRGTVRGLGVALFIVLTLIGLAGIGAAWLALPELRPELVLSAAGLLFIFLPGGLIAAWRAGREVHDDEVSVRALPWGIEAFAREYAAARGLRLEDPDAFRHRFPSPFPGAPLRVMHGELSPGVPGWVALWNDDVWPQRRHRLVAVVPAPAGGESAVVNGYEAHVRAGLLVLAGEVSAEERTLVRLDALRTAAASAAAGVVATG